MFLKPFNVSLFEEDSWAQDVIDQYVNKHLHDATLIDDHTYKVGKITYRQKVYRLKDHTIYVHTETLKEGIEHLLKTAIKEERYEDAKKLVEELQRNKK